MTPPRFVSVFIMVRVLWVKKQSEIRMVVKTRANKYNMNHWNLESKSYKCRNFDLGYPPWLELRCGEFAGQDNVFRNIDCYNIFESTMRCLRIKLN